MQVQVDISSAVSPESGNKTSYFLLNTKFVVLRVLLFISVANSL